MKTKFTSLLLVIALIFGIQAESKAQSEAGILFLLISPGVRADGMGEAFVAVADDASAIFWNSGGLAFLENNEFLFMHSNWLPQLSSDLFYDYGAFTHPVDGLGTFGLSITYMNFGEQNVTDERGPEVIDKFTSYDFAVSGAFGTKIKSNIGLGVNMKIIRSNLAPFGAGKEEGTGQAWTFGVDLGILYKQFLFDRLNFGINLSNMGPKVAYIDVDQADPQPTNLKLGFAYRLLDSEFNKITLTADFNKLLVRRYTDGKSDPFYKAIFTSWGDEPFDQEMKKVISHVGMEYWYAAFFALRAGYWDDKIGKIRAKTFGAGFRYSIYQIDFGYIAAGKGHPLSDTMRFSFSVIF